MEDFERHPEDTDQLHLDLATKVIADGKTANRTYIFAMQDRIEVAFAQVRALQGYSEGTERSFCANYHTGISLDFDAARTLSENLRILLDNIESSNTDDQDAE